MTSEIARGAAELRAFALGLPGAHEEFPWGERVVKVRAKVFVFLGHAGPEGEQLSLSVKLPESGVKALDRPFAEPTGYGLGKSGWVTARFERGDRPPIDVLRGWIEESYRAVAPKKLVLELDGTGKGTSAGKGKKRGGA